MKVEIYDKENSYDEFRYHYDIVAGDMVLSFSDGEPEDNTLSRNFSDVYSIPKLIEMAYQAGKSGEELEIIHCVGENEDE